MRRIGHAGLDAEYPPNTVAGIEGAVPHVDMVEIDLRRCGSGEIVLFHDETLDRITGREGRLAETPLSELQKLSIFDSDHRVTTLARALEAVPPSVGINLELKEPGIEAAVRDVVAEVDNELLVSSFYDEVFRTVNDLGWDVDTGYLFETAAAESLETAIALDCEFVHPHFELCLQTDIVAAAHERGLGVNAWTVTAEEVLEELQALGVDGCVVDRSSLC